MTAATAEPRMPLAVRHRRGLWLLVGLAAAAGIVQLVVKGTGAWQETPSDVSPAASAASA